MMLNYSFMLKNFLRKIKYERNFLPGAPDAPVPPGGPTCPGFPCPPANPRGP